MKSSKIRQDHKYFDIYFCVLFDCYCQSLISGWEAEHNVSTMSQPKFEIFLIFPNFLRPY